MSPLPPGPRTPAVYNIARFALAPLDTLFAWQRRYGNVFTVTFPAFGPGIYVGEPEAIRTLFSGDQSDLLSGEPNQLLSPLLGRHSVLVLDGPEHLRQRKLLLPPFQGSHVTAFRDVIRDVAEREVDSWQRHARFRMRDAMRRVTFEVICRAVFGVDETARIAVLRDALTTLIDSGTLVLATKAGAKDLGPLSPGGRFARRRRFADELLYAEITRRRGVPDLDQRQDVLSLLLRARDEDGRPLSDVELRDELMTMLAAGFETTSTALAFAVELLLRNPRALGRLREELTAGQGDDYLDATVKETLRLRPIIDAPQRVLTAPRRVGDYDLPAGAKVYPAIALVHHREDLYPQPDAFRPERFLDEGASSAFSWLPFGGGIRRCIGAALAQAEMAEVLRAIVLRSALRPQRPQPDPVILRTVTLTPKYGVPVAVG